MVTFRRGFSYSSKETHKERAFLLSDGAHGERREMADGEGGTRPFLPQTDAVSEGFSTRTCPPKDSPRNGRPALISGLLGCGGESLQCSNSLRSCHIRALRSAVGI